MIKPNLDTMNHAELAELATACLSRLRPGKQPLSLFTQLARLVVTSTIEVVLLRQRNDGLDVLLVKRPANDPWWPSQWHLPGTVLLPTDTVGDVHNYDMPLGRLFSEDFDHSLVKNGDVHIFDVQRRLTPRGSEQTVFAWLLVDVAEGASEPEDGEFFDAGRIESRLSGQAVVEGHLDTVKNALNDYRTAAGPTL